jgi:AcrR family transcriptional regulator
VSSIESDAPRWRRLEPDARREQILDCAVRLFGERPYAAVSTTEIAREAGVARGLLNHYFGTKRELYLEVVRRMVILPDLFEGVTSGSMEQRVEQSVQWFLDTVSPYGKTFVAVIGAEGVGSDSEVEAILVEADDMAASRVLLTLGLPADTAGHSRAMIRAYGGLVKAAIREWVRDGALDREQVQLLLSQALISIVRNVLPTITEEPRP